MKKIKKVIFGCSFILFLGLSNIVYAANGTVTGKTVRIRESADANSKIVTNAYRNDTVKVIDTTGDWYKVEFEGKTGYISKEFVEVKEAGNQNSKENEGQSSLPTDSEQSQEKIQTIKETNLKILPNFSSRSIGTIQEGIEIKIEQEFNNWVQITAGSNCGWILKNNISGYEKINNKNSDVPTQVTIDANTTSTETPNKPEPTPEPENVSTDVKNQRGYINTDTVRIRQTPGGKIIGNLDINDQVTIIEEDGEWYKITCSKFESGYVSKKLITIGTISSRSLQEPRNIENNISEQNIPEPEEKVEQEKIAEPVEETKTEEPQQQPIEEPVIQPEPEQPVQEPVVQESNKGEEIVAYAKSFLGCRYISGGTSPNGFDCSGFTQYVYSHFGYSIARVASAQASNGTGVDRNNLQPGDILVFQDYGRTCIGHVGIYIGDGNFVHAANPSRGVVIDNLNSNSYYNIRYVCARRII